MNLANLEARGRQICEHDVGIHILLILHQCAPQSQLLPELTRVESLRTLWWCTKTVVSRSMPPLGAGHMGWCVVCWLFRPRAK